MLFQRLTCREGEGRSFMNWSWQVYEDIPGYPARKSGVLYSPLPSSTREAT